MLALALALALLALLTLSLLALALAAALRLLLLLLLLAPAQRELEVEARVVELGVLAQRLLVSLDRVVEPVLSHQRVAAVVVGRAADARIARLGALLEVLERALGEPPLLRRIARRLRLLELGRAAVERQAVGVDPAAARRAIVGRERVVEPALGVRPVAGLDVGIRGPERLPAAERDDGECNQRCTQRGAHAHDASG